MNDFNQLTRREVLHLAGAAAALPMWNAASVQADERKSGSTKARKRVIVAGGGIGGLCCAFELMGRGHDVTVLEAARRAGGHVQTIRDPLPDGLYADVGAGTTNPRCRGWHSGFERGADFGVSYRSLLGWSGKLFF